MDSLICYLSSNFEKDFAPKAAKYVISNNMLSSLYDIATEKQKLNLPDFPAINKAGYFGSGSSVNIEKVVFRASYVLEKVFFIYREEFNSYKEDFLNCFYKVNNESAKRHFSKMAYELLLEASKNGLLDKYNPALLDSIAQNVSDWIINPKTKVAVLVWSVEILKLLRDKIEWVDESFNDMLEGIMQRNTPALQARFRNSWAK